MGSEMCIRDRNTPEAKAGLKSRLYKALEEIQDNNVKGLYKTALLDRFSEEFASNRFTTFADSKNYKLIKITEGVKVGSQRDVKRKGPEFFRNQKTKARTEATLIGAILEFPELLERVDERLFELDFTHPACAAIQRAVLDWWRQTKAVEKTHLLAHIEAEGLEQDYRVLSRQRLLIRAGMGGTDASLDERAALWNAQADTLLGQNQTDADLNDTRARLVETISGDNSDGMHRAMRASKEVRD